MPIPSHIPIEHAVPIGRCASGGHAVEVPLQVSAWSHSPVARRQIAPAGATPVGMHTGVPVVQSVVPIRHSSGTTHVSPAMQTSQAPAPSQARPGAQRVP